MKTAAALTIAFAATTASADPISYEKYRTVIAESNWNKAIGASVRAIKPLIVGGTEVPVGTAQYVAGMRSTADGKSFCGGSLIHPKWILTAAHCASSIAWVNVGTHFLSGMADGTPVKVLRKIQHPNYIAASTDNDFLLLELEKEVPYTPIKLAAANGADEPVGATAKALGWGTTSSGGPQSKVMLQVDVDLIANAECKKALSITDSMICAGGKLNKDSCQDDSGGPLVVNKNGTAVLVGVVSWGFGCGVVGFPGVYARVSAARPFIDQHVKQVRWV